MRLVHRLLVLIVAPAVALAFLPHQQGRSIAWKASRLLAAADFNDNSPNNVVKTRRELRVEKLQQEIQRQLQQRESLRLQLEQDIITFEKEYEAERSKLESADASLTKQFQRLEQIQTGGLVLEGSFGGLLAPSLVALSGAVVVGRNVLVQRREAQERLEQERLKQERLEQEEERKQMMQEEILNRRTAIASIAGAGAIGTGLFVSLLTDKNTGLQEADMNEAAPVVVDVTPSEPKPTPPEDVLAPSIGQGDTPPPTVSNEENGPANVENEQGESLEIIDIPDMTKLGDTFTAALENVSGNTPILAGVGATATAALVATLVGLFKDEKASGISIKSPLKTDLDLDSTKSSVTTTMKVDDLIDDKSRTQTRNTSTPVAKPRTLTEKPGPVDSKPETQLEHMEAKPKTEPIAEKTLETKETGAVASKTSSSQPSPSKATESQPGVPMEVKPSVQSELREVTSRSAASKSPTSSLADDASKASVSKPTTIVDEEKSVSTPPASSVDEKLEPKVVDMRSTESTPDTPKSTSATTQSSKAHTSNSVTESGQKDLTAALSSSDIQEIKSKVFGKTDDVFMDTSTAVPGNLELFQTQSSSSTSSNGVAWKQDSFSGGPKPSGDTVLPVNETAETEMKASDEPKTARASKPPAANRSPAQGFGKPAAAKSKRNKH